MTSMATIASLVAILLMTLHMAYDLRHAESAVSNLATVAILATWLCGTLMLGERRSRYVVILLGSAVAVASALVHMVGSGITRGSAYFFVWTSLALAVTGLLSAMLSVRGLWRLRRAPRAR